jgi:hypothetical protein
MCVYPSSPTGSIQMGDYCKSNPQTFGTGSNPIPYPPGAPYMTVTVDMLAKNQSGNCISDGSEPQQCGGNNSGGVYASCSGTGAQCWTNAQISGGGTHHTFTATQNASGPVSCTEVRPGCWTGTGGPSCIREMDYTWSAKVPVGCY